MGRILGVDWGLKRIGLALSDPTKLIASTLKNVASIKELLEVIAQYELEEIVIGLPYRMNGQIGLQADEVKHFALKVKEGTNVPVTLWDERLTTVQAERTMKEAGLSRKKRAKAIDPLAAAIMLQSYLDKKRVDDITG